MEGCRHMSRDIRTNTQEEFNAKIEELKEKGYIFEEENKAEKYWFGIISEEIVKRAGKCGYCNSIIEVRGIYAHRRTCESCGEVLCLDVLKDNIVRFCLREKMNGCDIELKFHSEDREKRMLYFYKKDIPEPRALFAIKKDQVLPALTDIIEEEIEIDGHHLIGIRYNIGKGLLGEDIKINVIDYGRGFKNGSVVKLYEGKEYGEWDFGDKKLPIAETLHVYKDWLIKKDASEILRRNRMNNRPDYYSGRGATLTDLTSEHLEGIHSDIQKNHGDEAAEQFIDMVEEIEVLSATAFVQAIQRLEKNQWKWDSRLLNGLSGISYRNEAGMLGTLMGVISSRGNDQTGQIRNPFLRKMGRPTKIKRVIDQFGDYYIKE